jgi:dipeptidyl aminopeptidase/acylaminoacyl peptidase
MRSRYLRRIHPVVLVATLLVLLPAATEAQAVPDATQRPITPEDLWAMGRVGGPVVSPDGLRVAYAITWYDVDANRGNSDIWVVRIEGGEAVRMTSSPGADTQPAWSPEGRWLAFMSTRGGNGPQIYLLPSDGGEATPLTSAEGGATSPVWSRDGRKIMFISEVWPEGDAGSVRLKELEEGPTGAKIYDELMYRHWDMWEDGMRSHVLMVDVETGETTDLTKGPYDTPPISLGSSRDFDLSPDGSELAFVRNTDVPTAIGTGNDIWLVPASGGEPRLLTESDANDTSPRYSPDGNFIAYTAMRRPGFEADRTRLVVYERRNGEHRTLTEELDRSVGSFAWSRDGSSIFFLAQDGIYRSLYRVSVSSGETDRLTSDTYLNSFAVTPDGATIVVAHQSNAQPTELFVLSEDGQMLRQLTHVNREKLAGVALQEAEVFTFRGANRTEVEGFLIKPPGFEAGRKYPLVYLVHGGPQGAWSDVFHYRWNANMFAAPGYVVVAVNPRGSTGYGQQFTDEITGDWGGKVFQDLMNGLDHVLATYDFIDESRMAAAGASYGGYMMNWFEGHTTRFRTLVNHDGVTNTISMYGSTEELWFPEWEFGGTPWDNPGLYVRWNPMEYVDDFQTPMLVIHGGLDYRVPLGQGLEIFTALRRKDIRARLLYFPDEGHWVLQPQNAMVWWDTVYDWLAEYLKN